MQKLLRFIELQEFFMATPVRQCHIFHVTILIRYACKTTTTRYMKA